MALRINTNIAAIEAGRSLDKPSRQLYVSLQRLSDGLRINSAKDDIAGLAVAEAFRARSRGDGATQGNAQAGATLTMASESALGETSTILQRIRELAAQSTNGTLTGTNRASISEEATRTETEDAITNSGTVDRGAFGAFMSRLESTIDNLAIQEENAAASESSIRDADIAKVAIEFTKSRILVSAETAVLAQANILPQGALSLLS